jgi:hypothetical protein
MLYKAGRKPAEESKENEAKQLTMASPSDTLKTAFLIRRRRSRLIHIKVCCRRG